MVNSVLQASASNVDRAVKTQIPGPVTLIHEVRVRARAFAFLTSY